jgi:hypothetical protein
LSKKAQTKKTRAQAKNFTSNHNIIIIIIYSCPCIYPTTSRVNSFIDTPPIRLQCTASSRVTKE